MAEAHQAVAFQFAVTDEGIHIHFDSAAVKQALRSFLGLFKYRYWRARNAVLKGVFPASPLSLVVILAALWGIFWSGGDPSWGAVTKITAVASFIGVGQFYLSWLLLAGEAVVLWIILCYIQRYLLKALLMYKGWMFDPRGKQSLTTKIWAMAVKVVTGPFRPGLYSYQNSLPRLPVPSLEGTCKRYLESIRPLLDDEAYAEMEKLVKDFKDGPGKKMQRFLVLKSWWASNYVTDWWEQYVYLYGRSSIMINSNYYAGDNIGFKMTSNPAARAGMVVHTSLRLRREIESGHLKPLIIMGLIPLCSSQYERLFGTTRIPGREADKLVHYSEKESNYIVIYRQGRWYRVEPTKGKRILTAAELEQVFQQILDDTEGAPVGPGEEHLAALTACDRKSWAEMREEYFSKGVNKKSVETIDKAAFMLVFDENRPTVECAGSNCGEEMALYCKDLLHGNGYTRWFDKSMTCVIYENGKFGVNAEHSWADAPIIGYLLEYCCNLEHQRGYHDDGHCIGTIKGPLPKPERLKWDIPQQAVSRIDAALSLAQEQIADLDLHILQHTAFGKGDIKKCKISPDAFIQMAIQLAYFKDSGNKFCLTYEASMTRLYLEGRTETVRPVTIESAAFVRAMTNPLSTNEERKKLLSKAVERHALGYKLAMTGKGIDRHLFCLYVMSKYLKIESPFLDKVLSEPWRLSTSQTPAQQTGKLDFDNEKDKISVGGGFGPVTKDGYGVSYIIQGDYVILFHISSFKSSPYTDCHRYANQIADCMKEMRDLCLDMAVNS